MKTLEKVMTVVVLAVVVMGAVAGYGYYTRSTQLAKAVKEQNQEISELKESNKKLNDEVADLHESNHVDEDGNYTATVYDEDGKEHNIVITHKIINYSVSEVEK